MDDMLLTLVHPTGQGDDEKGKRGQQLTHRRRLSRTPSPQFSSNFSRFEGLHSTGPMNVKAKQ